MTDETLFWRTKIVNGRRQWEGFPPYDLEKAKRRLNPEKKAESFAVSTPSGVDDSILSGDEIEFIADVNRHVAQLRDWYVRGVAAIKDFIGAAVSDADLDQGLQTIRDAFSRSMRQILASFYTKNERNFKDLRIAERELRAFRRNNNLLDRSAYDSDSVSYDLAILFAVLVGESILNSYFFGQASDLGLLGGFLTAFIVSAANVTLSFLTGILFLRELNHIRIVRKLFGGIGLVASICLLGLLHLSIAHYRELLTRNPDEHFQAVLQPMFDSPLALQDIESLVLIIFGLAISLGSIYKGYKIADVYPGYTTKWKSWKNLDDQARRIETELQSAAGSAYDVAVASSQELVATLKSAKRNLQAIEGDIDGFLNGSVTYYETARASAASLLSSYRNVIQIINNDVSSFAFDVSLLDQKNGLLLLDPEDGRIEIEERLTAEISRIDQTNARAPEAQRVLLDELGAERIDATSREAIQSTLDDIAVRATETLDRIGIINDVGPVPDGVKLSTTEV